MLQTNYQKIHFSILFFLPFFLPFFALPSLLSPSFVKGEVYCSDLLAEVTMNC